MMNKIKELIKENNEIIKYLIFGALTTLISLTTYFIMTLFLDVNEPIQLQVCNITSWILSILFAFFTNKIFVFKSKEKKTIKELIKFLTGRIITLLIDMIIMFIFVSLMHFNDKIVKLLLQIIIIILNYIISKYFVFKKENKNHNDIT